MVKFRLVTEVPYTILRTIRKVSEKNGYYIITIPKLFADGMQLKKGEKVILALRGDDITLSKMPKRN